MIHSLEQAAQRPVSRETFEKLRAYVELLRAENEVQNLVAKSTLEHVWERHILDSAQLVRFEPRPCSTWIDIGSGAGLPGIVIACLVAGRVTLSEPRRLRADFLARIAKKLDLDVLVECAKAERLTGKYDVLTARAVAPLTELLEMSHHLSTGKSRWVLPKGQSAHSELAEAERAWHGVFHVEPSMTDANSWIVVGTGVRAKAK